MKSLNCNLITAELDRERGIAKFKYGDLDYFPKVLVYGGMSLVTQSGVEGQTWSSCPLLRYKG